MAGVVVVNADDLGISRGATLGIVKAHREGVVTSASLSPTGADYTHAVEACLSECPKLGIGLHFTLSSGRPVSAPDQVPLLVGDDGFLRWRFGSLLRAVAVQRRSDLLEQIEIELEAQIQRLLADGITPDHIDGERHVHQIPGIFESVASAARRHGIPFVRAGLDLGWRHVRPTHFVPVVLHGGFVKFSLLQALTLRNRGKISGVRTTDHVASYLFSGRLDLLLAAILRQPPDGITEIMVHPGIPEESAGAQLGNRELERYLTIEDRRRELDACIHSNAPSAVLSNFSDLA